MLIQLLQRPRPTLKKLFQGFSGNTQPQTVQPPLPVEPEERPWFNPADIPGSLALLLDLYSQHCPPSPLQPRLVWGPVPLINNKYWSNSMRKAGFCSDTLMSTFYQVFRKEDFDIYFQDLEARFDEIYETLFAPLTGEHAIFQDALTNQQLKECLRSQAYFDYFIFLYAITNYDIFHFCFSGGFLQYTPLWDKEIEFLKTANKKVVVLAYGGDVYLYSRVQDPCVRHCLINDYPAAARREPEIKERVEHAVKYADAILPSNLFDGVGRWDIAACNVLNIDISQWYKEKPYSDHDGFNGPVKVIHTPNHRSYKGTEFLLDAIESLQKEGLQIELILLEMIPNEEVRRLMREEADILAEQFIYTGHGLSALEGLASGLPVLSNLESEYYTRVFRRYSFLNECPILSTTPENIKENLRLLVTHPKLRAELGMAGRTYVEKYHSDETTQYMFGSIYDKIWHNKDVNLLNLFHPLKSEFNNRRPKVNHPLVNNKLPADYVLKNMDLSLSGTARE